MSLRTYQCKHMREPVAVTSDEDYNALCVWCAYSGPIVYPDGEHYYYDDFYETDTNGQLLCGLAFDYGRLQEETAWTKCRECNAIKTFMYCEECINYYNLKRP